MQFDQVPHDRQAKPSAAGITRTRFVHAIEALEDPAEIRLRYAGTVVANRQQHAIAAPACVQFDASAFR